MNRKMTERELEAHEALVDEEIRAYLAAHKGDRYDSPPEEGG